MSTLLQSWPRMALLLLLSAIFAIAETASLASSNGQELIQSSSSEAASQGAAESMQKVVDLLTDMYKTLVAESKEDEKQNSKFECWCKQGEQMLQEVQAAEQEVNQLEAQLDGQLAKKNEYEGAVAEFEKTAADGKKTLDEATTMRDDQIKKYKEEKTLHGTYTRALDSAVAVLKAGKTAKKKEEFTQLEETPSFLEEDASESEEKKSSINSDEGRSEQLSRSLESFMQNNGYASDVKTLGSETTAEDENPTQKQGFLAPKEANDDSLADMMDRAAGRSQPKPQPVPEVQQTAQTDQDSNSDGRLSKKDEQIVHAGLAAAAAFIQRETGEVMQLPEGDAVIGMLTTMKENMVKKWKETEAKEKENEKNFKEMEIAKKEEIAESEGMASLKKENLAATEMLIAMTEDEIAKKKDKIKADRKLLMDMPKMCAQGKANYKMRTQARNEESQAVLDATRILEEAINPEGEDSFLQLSQRNRLSGAAAARAAGSAAVAAALRRSASELQSSNLEAVADSVENSASAGGNKMIGKVIRAIDTMIEEMQWKNKDEEKSKYECEKRMKEMDSDIQEATDTEKASQTKLDELREDISEIEADIKTQKAEISEKDVELATASQNRQEAHAEFKQTMTDQYMTTFALKKARSKLNAVYKSSSLMQMRVAKAVKNLQEERRQQVSEQGLPPPPKMLDADYSKNGAAGGVMVLLDKLVDDAKKLTAATEKSEQEAIAAYEKVTQEISAAVRDMESIVFRKQAQLSKNHKKRMESERTTKRAIKTKNDMTALRAKVKNEECDPLIANFERVTSARRAEIGALNQAREMLRAND
eukprot:TRINITY_DN1253_c0_g1_i1.p1 TRINITY_DN1253_c0_g1~~TRINITY_DN1253_c0_g1_i1.p1  ORF type:complete len:819 (+),score=244.98 TRINITY_DN1253_c0_g1_i1:157-2613(+)